MILSVSAVGASDIVDNQDVSTSSQIDMLGVSSQEISNSNSTFDVYENNAKVLSADASNNNLLGADDGSTGSYNDLTELIKLSSGTLTLQSDYEYKGSGDVNSIVVSKSLIIDGNNHTINGNGVGGGFVVTADDVVVKNFDIVSALENVVKLNEVNYVDKPVKIEFEVGNDTKRIVNQNEIAFRLMMQNLIETLMREIDLGKVNVTISNTDNEFLTARNIPVQESVLITVSSVNMTIMESELSTLFNPYAIVDSTRKKTISRALALGCVSNIAKDLGGVVWAELSPMKGPVFNIVIPREKVNNE